MPRDMFGDVNQPSIKIGNRKWYTVPVSLFSHAMIVVAIVAIPILVPAAMPPLNKIPIFNGPPPVPPEPPRPKPIEVDAKPQPDPNLAPITVPKGFTPEPDVRPGFENEKPTIGVVGGGGGGELEPPPVVTVAPPDVPMRVGGIIRPPMKLAGLQPVYPPIAQSARVQGIVIIEATIGTDGHVVNAKVLRSIPLLDQAALDAVRTWSYSPTLLNGIPVAVIMTVTVQFSLQ